MEPPPRRIPMELNFVIGYQTETVRTSRSRLVLPHPAKKQNQPSTIRGVPRLKFLDWDRTSYCESHALEVYGGSLHPFDSIRYKHHVQNFNYWKIEIFQISKSPDHGLDSGGRYAKDQLGWPASCLIVFSHAVARMSYVVRRMTFEACSGLDFSVSILQYAMEGKRTLSSVALCFCRSKNYIGTETPTSCPIL